MFLFWDYKAAKCLSCGDGQCSRMGYHADKSPARGDFYLMTNQKGASPQCSECCHVTISSNKSKYFDYYPRSINISLHLIIRDLAGRRQSLKSKCSQIITNHGVCIQINRPELSSILRVVLSRQI